MDGSYMMMTTSNERYSCILSLYGVLLIDTLLKRYRSSSFLYLRLRLLTVADRNFDWRSSSYSQELFSGVVYWILSVLRVFVYDLWMIRGLAHWGGSLRKDVRKKSLNTIQFQHVQTINRIKISLSNDITQEWWGVPRLKARRDLHEAV